MMKLLIIYFFLFSCKPKSSTNKQLSNDFTPKNSYTPCKQIRNSQRGYMCLTEYDLWKIIPSKDLIEIQKNISFDKLAAKSFATALSTILKKCVQGQNASIKIIVSNKKSASILIPFNQKHLLNKNQRSCLNQAVNKSLPVPNITATQVVTVNFGG